MEFQEKHKLIEQTVQYYVDKFGMFTADDLVSEAWCHRQVREANESARVIKATKDACVDFLRRWHKTGAGRNNREIKIMHMGSMLRDHSDNIDEREPISAVELLKADLCKLMNKEEKKIVEYRLQGLTYEKIARKIHKKRSTVYAIHKRMQERMKSKQEQLLGD